ncbi:fucose isomerase [Candidatus Thorarchaeota archaeon]|nr:MAG: fucose isomerase [Candidatus Thorarchaeota archaeon]
MAFNLITLFSPITPRDVVKSILGRVEKQGATIYTPQEFEKDAKSNPSLGKERTYLFIGTGGTEQIAAELLESVDLAEPVLLLAHDRSNSLPAALEIRSYADQIGLEAKVIHDSLEKLASKIRTWSGYADVQQKIRECRLGVIGEPSFWLIASGVDRKKVKERWGVEIQSYDLGLLTVEMKEGLGRKHQRMMTKHLRESSSVEVQEEEIDRVASVAQALQEVASKEKLDAVTLECFNLLEETNVSGCYAISLLNDLPDIVAGCEGDVPATFTMLLTKLLVGKPSFMANIASADLRSNTVVFSHCTLPLSMTDSYETLTHFETGLSVGLRGTIVPQPVTIFKVHGEDLSNWWVSSGEIVENLRNETGCRTQLRVVMDEPVSYFLEGSLANHHIVVLGDHTKEISSFMDFVESYSPQQER